jgi:hypothetical protein
LAAMDIVLGGGLAHLGAGGIPLRYRNKPPVLILANGVRVGGGSISHGDAAVSINRGLPN